MPFILGKSMFAIVLGLSLFIALLSFKPSEPYLSQFLICNQKTASEFCSDHSQPTSCSTIAYCSWNNLNNLCQLVPCSNVSLSLCDSSDFYYCEKSSSGCKSIPCYMQFTDHQVNDEIYPWSTYAYLPFLLILGPFAELYSYQIAILLGILGRVATRAILLYGKSLQEMRLMQVAYSLGTAAEDVFSAYVYYVVRTEDYQYATSSIKAAALIACVLSGILGDILVVEYDTSLTVLMWISAGFVWAGFLVGLFVIQPTRKGKSTSDASIATPLIKSDTFATPTRSQLDIFAYQLRCLRVALRSRTVQSMLGLWIVGNAVFQTLYDYEVSIFQELQGQNSSWNGSVLAAMLIAGSVGAMLPALSIDPLTWMLRVVWMRLKGPTCTKDTLSQEEKEEEKEKEIEEKAEEKEEEVVMTSRIMVASIVAGVSLVGVMLTWEVVATVTYLALFFATWQYVNVVVFARFATYLKRAETHTQVPSVLYSVVESDEVEEVGDQQQINDQAELQEKDTIDPPYSFAIVMIIAVNVLVQIVLQAICFSVLQLTLYAACCYVSYVFIAAVSFYALVTVAQFGFGAYGRSWQRWWRELV